MKLECMKIKEDVITRIIYNFRNEIKSALKIRLLNTFFLQEQDGSEKKSQKDL